MTFLISDAFAVTAPASSGVSAQNSFFNILLLGLLIAVLYFMWRSQNKRLKSHQAMMSSLQMGDEIITNGGIFGKITQIEDNILSIALSENTVIKMQKTAIATILPKGTLK